MLPSELAALPGTWIVEVIATRGRWGLNPKRDSLGRAAFLLQLAPAETAGVGTRTTGIRPDTLRPVGGRHFVSRTSQVPFGIASAPEGTGVWMFGRTLFAGHPGGTDAIYDAFELSVVDSLRLSGRFFRSWGLMVPLGVSGDSVEAPVGYFCGRRLGQTEAFRR